MTWSPSNGDFMWLVGLLEGEGSFVVTWDKTSHPKPYPKFRLGISSVDKDVIDKVCQLLGTKCGGPYHYRKTDPGNQAYFQTALGRKIDLKIILEDLRPHMSARRQGQIDIMLEAIG